MNEVQKTEIGCWFNENMAFDRAELWKGFKYPPAKG